MPAADNALEAINGAAGTPVRVRYLHGRPGPHPLHARFAEAVGGEFEYIDFKLRWQDKNRPRLYVITSWFLCAAALPKRREFDVFLVDNLHVPPVLMKRLALRRDQKIVAHLGSHTPYFLLSHRFGRLVERLHLWALRNYDALICDGRMTVEIVRELLGDHHPPIYESFIGADGERLEVLTKGEPDLDGRRIVFIGGGPAEFRLHYKGLDLMIDAFAIAAESDPTIEFDILGEWDDETLDSLTAALPPETRSRIHFRGEVEGIAEYATWLRRGSLYLHCGRGDAFPTATIEAMAAGLVPLVSEWTGTRQIVAEVTDRLVAPLDAAEIATRISWYFALSHEQRRRLSRLSRAAAQGYTEQAATAHYQETFTRICEDLGLVPRS
jgi:glycosyltransferase involved in cell wall biosynthesis